MFRNIRIGHHVQCPYITVLYFLFLVTTACHFHTYQTSLWAYMEAPFVVSTLINSGFFFNLSLGVALKTDTVYQSIFILHVLTCFSHFFPPQTFCFDAVISMHGLPDGSTWSTAGEVWMCSQCSALFQHVGLSHLISAFTYSQHQQVERWRDKDERQKVRERGRDGGRGAKTRPQQDALHHSRLREKWENEEADIGKNRLWS